MKSKLTLFCLGMLAFGAVNAQEAKVQDPFRIPMMKSLDPVQPHTINKSSFSKGGQVEDWFSFANGLLNFAPNPAGFAGYVAFIFPDTNVIMLDNGDTARYWPQFHAFGQAFDPVDPIFEYQDPSLSSIFHARDRVKSVDSVAFRYLYIRNIETQDLGGGEMPVVDTLIVEFYKGRRRNGSGGTYGLNAGWRFTPPGEPVNWFARPEFDIPSQKGTLPVGSKTFLLTNADTTGETSDENTGWRSPYFVVGTDGITLDSGEVFGYAVYFRPGSVYSVGDTILSTGTKKPSKRTANYFGFRYLVNNSTGIGDQIGQTEYFNNLYWILSGWNNTDPNDNSNLRQSLEYGFVPGNIYNSQYYLESQFYTTGTSSLSAKALENDYVLGTAYPNPVNAGNSIRFDYKSVNSTPVTLEVYDILGKKVAEVAGDAANNINTIELSTAGFENGIYVANMIVNGQIVSSQKFNVVK